MPTPNGPKILRGAPYFPVADVARTGAYYRDVLGFQLEYTGGDPPEFAIYSRDGCALMLRHGKGASFAYGPTLQPYGMKEFAARDPHGYVLGFGEALQAQVAT